MKSKFKYLLAITVVVLLAGITSCKPTEANYQSAYDAALAKRTQVDPDADILYGNHKLSSTLGATPSLYGNDTVLTLYAPATLLHEGPGAAENRFRTVIAFYRMEQNAADHARRLAAEGAPGAAVAKLGDEKFLVVAASAPTREQGAEYTARLRRQSPQGPWIGLTPPEPILLITSN